MGGRRARRADRRGADARDLVVRGRSLGVHEEIPVPAEGDSKHKAAAMMQQATCSKAGASGSTRGLAHATARFRRPGLGRLGALLLSYPVRAKGKKVAGAFPANGRAPDRRLLVVSANLAAQTCTTGAFGKTQRCQLAATQMEDSPGSIGECAGPISMRSSTSKPQLRSSRAQLVDCLWSGAASMAQERKLRATP
jgi:hypothetical protein